MARNERRPDDEDEDDPDDEVDETPKRRAPDRDDEDDRPRARRRDDHSDRDEDEQPRRRKKKKRKKANRASTDSSLLLEERERKINLELGDWVLVGMLFSFGIIMCLVAAIGIAGAKHAFLALFVMFVYFLLLLPVSIGTLMGAGMLMNIDYGEWKVAIMRLAAISSFNNGLIWVGEWIGLPFFITLGFCALMLFGLLMTVFELDPQEALATVGALNLVQFVARFILIGLAVLQARHEEKKYNRDDDDRPKYNHKVDEDFGKGKQMPPGDEFDDE